MMSIPNIKPSLTKLLSIGLAIISPSITWATDIKLPSGVSVDLNENSVKLPITYVGEKSGLEFLVTKGFDKDYEALFSSSVSGKDLHMGLLMIGLEPNTWSKEKPKENTSHGNVSLENSGNTTQIKTGKESTPKLKALGTAISANVLLGTEEQPIENYVIFSDGKKTMDLSLYFSGSRFTGSGKHRQYGADLSLNLLGAWPDSDMVVGPKMEVGNPYIDDDGPHLTPNPERPLKHHQKATLILRKK
jgi:hypothetical protein